MKKKMKYVWIIAVLMSIYVIEVIGTPRLKVYMNPRFGFSIAYPDLFTEEQFSDNGDGIILTNKDTDIELIAYGSNNIEEQKPQEAYIEMLSQTPDVIESSFKGHTYQIKWDEAGKQLVLQVRVGKGSKNGFRLSYPTSEAKHYKEMIDILSENFKTPLIEEMH